MKQTICTFAILMLALHSNAQNNKTTPDCQEKINAHPEQQVHRSTRVDEKGTIITTVKFKDNTTCSWEIPGKPRKGDEMIQTEEEISGGEWTVVYLKKANGKEEKNTSPAATK